MNSGVWRVKSSRIAVQTEVEGYLNGVLPYGVTYKSKVIVSLPFSLNCPRETGARYCGESRIRRRPTVRSARVTPAVPAANPQSTCRRRHRRFILGPPSRSESVNTSTSTARALAYAQELGIRGRYGRCRGHQDF